MGRNVVSVAILPVYIHTELGECPPNRRGIAHKHLPQLVETGKGKTSQCNTSHIGKF